LGLNSNTFTLSGWDVNPSSRGQISLSDGFTGSNPVVKPNFFSTSDDIDSIVNLYLYMYHIFALLRSTNPTDGYTLLWPPESLFTTSNNNQAIFEFAASNLLVNQDWSGGCRMGANSSDPSTGQGVVDNTLHVYGVENLMVNVYEELLSNFY
jgi:choline dehydrogenase-like flavoprotein